MLYDDLLQGIQIAKAFKNENALSKHISTRCGNALSAAFQSFSQQPKELAQREN